jgi:hypothetical protein
LIPVREENSELLGILTRSKPLFPPSTNDLTRDGSVRQPKGR